MKRFLLPVFVIMIFGCTAPGDPVKPGAANEELPPIDTNDLTNDFFDNVSIHQLPLGEITIDGEIENPGIFDPRSLPLRSVIVKETVIEGEGNSFVGAYKYEGYSLKDILNGAKIDKLNKEAFPPIIDLYVVVSNHSGEKVLISWGEIYYPVHQHEIIVAIRVMQIVPSLSKDLWPLPEKAKIVIAADLLSERNIEDPVKFTIRSLKRDFVVDRTLDSLFSEGFDIIVDHKTVESVTEYPSGYPMITYPTTFYGRGRGIHGISPFEGILLKEILAKHVSITPQSLSRGMVTIAAIDGYRGAFTFSEIFNRNDQAEILLVNQQDDLKGDKYSVFPAADFFSDRVIRGINEIYVDIIEE